MRWPALIRVLLILLYSCDIYICSFVQEPELSQLSQDGCMGLSQASAISLSILEAEEPLSQVRIRTEYIPLYHVLCLFFLFYGRGDAQSRNIMYSDTCILSCSCFLLCGWSDRVRNYVSQKLKNAPEFFFHARPVLFSWLFCHSFCRWIDLMLFVYCMQQSSRYLS